MSDPVLLTDPLLSSARKAAIRTAGNLMLLARLSGGTEQGEDLAFTDPEVAQALRLADPTATG
jgi:hypothetical protein